MPLIKLSSDDGKLTKLVAAKDFDSLKQKGFLLTSFYMENLVNIFISLIKAEEKLGYKIGTFTRKEDDLEVENDEVLQEMLSCEKEVWLIAKTKNSEKLKTESRVLISTLNQTKPVPFIAKSLESLRNQGTKF